MKHSSYSPSAAHRWVKCRGSVSASANLVKTNTEFTTEGSIAHKCCEEKLINGVTDSTGFTSEMHYYADLYVDYVKKHRAKGSKLYVEKTVDIDKALKLKNIRVFGTCDAIVHKGDEVQLFDFKYGVGVPVYAKENYQMIMYAIGAIDFLNLPFKESTIVTTHIFQPRINNISYVEYNGVELKKYKRELRVAIEAIDNGDKTRTPGDTQCRFCPVKSSCLDFYNFVFTHEFRALFSTEISKLSDVERKKLLDLKPRIIHYLSMLELDVYNKLKGGGSFYGYHLERGKGRRTWSKAGQEFLIKKLGDGAYNTGKPFISIEKAKIKLKLTTKDVDELTERPEGKDKLIKDKDKNNEQGKTTKHNTTVSSSDRAK